MAQPVGEEDKVVVRYTWKHNHDDSSARLPLARNEREWIRRMVDESHDWCSLSSWVIPDEQSLQAVRVLSYIMFPDTHWFKEIEDKGGKTMFIEDATLTGFAYGWCTKFQLK
ncbi:hypothetical protein BGZ54_003249, partial [Gamsiella multidivaricata]